METLSLGAPEHCRDIPRVRVEGVGPRGSWTREWRSDGSLAQEDRRRNMALRLNKK